MTTDEKVAQAGADAINQTIALMGDGYGKRIGKSEYIQMADPDTCGVCGERQTRFYSVLDGVPVCGPCKGVSR